MRPRLPRPLPNPWPSQRAYASHVANLVDWALAEQIGLRFMPKGPTTTPTEAHGVVAELRELAQLAREPVRALTGLDADPEHAPAVVVDRGEWIQSNIAGLGVALDPFVSCAGRQAANPGIEAVGSRLTAAQLGGAMAWLSGKVLGQYEAFTAPGRPGRLLLVAPNIVHVERELELVPRDFRLWVCLHEETHRVQFGGVPWLQDHFLERGAGVRRHQRPVGGASFWPASGRSPSPSSARRADDRGPA